MRRLWNEFKSFAMSGNMLDLALGFIIGAAFAKIIDSLANNVLMQGVAAIFGKKDFTKLVWTVHGADIKFGAFLTDLVNFLLLVALLFVVVKFIVMVGFGRGKQFGKQQCPYCEESIAPTALVCRFCRHELVDDLPTLTDARTRLDELERKRGGLPVSLPIPIPGRRKASKSDDVSTL
jgi:large conductance mechanosensitive channel